ncbi:MAG: sigma 54-interacting transcriptional regulator [Desulfobacterales bacterium]|nr:sigma 54-interacting transcriptional regulator [Desulfobacterales bacterium]MBL7173185.1 sigma 54-interacting transcriptional regulator [Desulfobacteraceae bacterium]
MFDNEYSKYWQTVVQTMLDGLMIVDPDGIIISTNDALEELTGYTRDELIGQSCDILECSSCFGTRKDGGDKHCALFNAGKVRHSRCILKRKDGSPLHVMKNAAILKDSEGVVVGGVETLSDYTELVVRDQVISSLRKELSIEDSFEGIIGTSPDMRQVFDLIQSAAQSEAPVIIYGESGTGKELVAGAIHRLSPRSDGPFIKVNCAALNESLLESELFGHVKGAFTGADRTRMGRFEAATKGSIFLDEIGDLPLSTQVKLLRVLQEKEIEKVGDYKPVPIDVRVVAATNRDLNRLMKEGQFRDDLYYRIGVIPIYLPALRDRIEDIPILVDAFVHRIQVKTGKPIRGMDKSALEMLMRHEWPGNVRELINVIEYAFVLCSKGDIRLEHLPRSLKETSPIPSEKKRNEGIPRKKGYDRNQIMDALHTAGGNKSEAARILGISRVTLWKRLNVLDIQVDREIRG